MFYIPHIIYKYFEGGKVKSIIAGLQMWVLDNSERSEKESELAKYIVETRGSHQRWCLELIFARMLYLVSVIPLFINCMSQPDMVPK